MVSCWYKLSISYRLQDISHLRFRLVTLTFQGPKGQIFLLFRKPIWDFVMVFCWYELSISYRLRDIPHLRFWLVTLTFEGHQRSNIRTLYLISFARFPHIFLKDHIRLYNDVLVDKIRSLSHTVGEISHIKDFGRWPWPFRVTKGQIFLFSWKAFTWLYNGDLLIQTLYLIPFARYSASKISVSDLDLSGSPKVKYFFSFVSESQGSVTTLIMVFCWYKLSISYRLRDIPLLRFRLVTLTFQGHQRTNIIYFFRKLICDFIMMFCW